MTRQIDVSDPGSLSLEDRVYLQDHDRLPRGAKPVSNATKAKLAEKVEKEQRELEAQVAAEDAEFDAAVANPEDSYDQMDSKELKALARERGVETRGKDLDEVKEELRTLNSAPEDV